jgi:hypothetical protein
MTDVSGLFFLLLCLLAVLQATDPDASLAKTVLWSAVLTIAGLIGGTVRQYNFFVPAAFLPYIAWRSRSLGARLWCGVCGLASVMGTWVFIHWFSLQPYALVMPLLPSLAYARFLTTAINSLDLVAEYALLVAPVTVVYAFAKVRLPRGWLVLSGASVLFAASLILSVPNGRHRLFQGAGGNLITETGILSSGIEVIGDKPRILSIPLQIALAGTGAGLLVLAAGMVVQSLRESHALSSQAVAKWLRSGSAAGRLEHACVLFSCIYCPLIVSRAIATLAFDRYLLPLLAIGGLAFLLRLPTGRPIKLTAGWAVAVLFALYGVATTHDYFACSRARLGAAELLQAADIPRQCISAGLEYDGWTEIALRGHINAPEMAVPPNSYKSQVGRKYPLVPPYWFWDYTPTVQPNYLVVLSSQPGLLTLKEFTVNYRAWIPPFERRALVQAPNPMVAECGPSTKALPATADMWR